MEEKQKTKKKCLVGEMETSMIRKGNWFACLVAGIIGVAFIIVEGVLGHFPAQFAIAAILFGWASTLYICQFVLAKRPWQVLIGAVLEGLACVLMIVLYVVSNVQAW